MKHDSSATPHRQSEKQQEKRKTQVGVWLDHHQAFVVSAPEGEFVIADNFETTAPEHNRTSEHTINNAEKALALKHFHAVAAHLNAYDHILLFGPGTAQEEMRNLLSDDIHFRDKKVTIDSSSQMTQNQMVAKVRDFFEPS
jgi:stalled ribosome rescue protein Dom34